MRLVRLEPKVRRARQVRLALQVRSVLPGHKVPRVRPARLELWGRRVHRVSRVLRDRLDLRVRLECLVHRLSR